MITSRLTAKGRTTIPQAVRTVLGLRAGDEVAYVVEDGRAVLSRFRPDAAAGDPFAAFSEWATAADAEAYGKL